MPSWVVAVGSLAWSWRQGQIAGAAGAAKGVWDFFKKQRGDTPLNPLFVATSSIAVPVVVVVLSAARAGRAEARAGAGEEDVAGEAGTLEEDASKGGGFLSKLGPVAGGIGKIAGVVGLVVTAASALDAFANAKGSLGNKVKAGIKAGDPTGLLNIVGLPSSVRSRSPRPRSGRSPGS